MFARSTKSGSELAKSGPDFDCLWRLLVRQKRRSNGGIRGPILRNNIFQKRIFGPDLLQFYKGYFYYKYRLCIIVNLEIEGAETRV